MSEALRVNNLWKVFAPPGFPLALDDPESLTDLKEQGGVVAVADVDLTLADGEFFVVMGLSGSGKSTFIRCLLRLIEPTAGTIEVAGEQITSLNATDLTQFRRQRIAMVFQHYGLLPHRNVLANVAFGLKLQGQEKAKRLEKARLALEQVGLSDWADHLPAELSGGMQQRVGIARALAKDPDILLMDEPFSGLDPLIRRDMQDELLRLQDEVEKTILFVTHDLDEALRLGDRMAVMQAGQFVQVDEPDAILADPADEYVARFVEGITGRRKRAQRAQARAAMAQSGGSE